VEPGVSSYFRMLYGEKQMRRLVQLAALMVCLFIGTTAYCSTYYIDFASGNDTNSGTKASPWQRAPYMNDFAGHYTHASGDQFIFKGGSTWPNSSFPITPAAGGSSSAPDYYGVDVTWYSGSNSGNVNTSGTQVSLVSGQPFQAANSSWVGGSITIGGASFTIASVQSPTLLTLTSSAGTQANVAYSNTLFVRPVFDSGKASVGTNNTEFNLATNGISWVTIDNIEWKGHFWSGSYGFAQNVTINGTGSANGLVVENNYFHGWTHAPYAGVTSYLQNSYTVLLGYGSPCPTCVVQGNVGSGATADGGDPQSTTFAFNWYQISNNILHDMVDAIPGSCHQVNGNTVYNIDDSFDQQPGNAGSGQHSDAIFCVLYSGDSTQYIYNNLVYSVSEGTEGPFFLEVGAQHLDGSAATAYVFNNTVYYGDWSSQLVLDNRCFGSGCNPANWTYHLWNNTAVQNASGCPPNTICTSPSVPGGNVTSQACVLVGAGGNATIGLVDLRNNHCGSNFAGPKIYSLGSGISVTTLNDVNNVLTSLSTLAANGYTTSNRFQPTSSGSITVGQGTNLASSASGPTAPLVNSLNAMDPATAGTSRPSSGGGSCPGGSGCWDAGAYQYGGGQSSQQPVAPANLQATVTSGGN
jgi:hypothetical protein